MTRDWLSEIANPDRIRDLRVAIEPVLEDAYDFSLEWISKQGWAVIPRPDVISDRDAEWIAAAASELGYESCVAVCTETDAVTGEGIAYTVPVTQHGLSLFSGDTSLRVFALLPEDGAFIVLSAGQSRFLVAGPKDFVRRAVGCSFRTARRIFLKRQLWLRSWEPSTWERMLYVSDRYSFFDGDAGAEGPGDPILDVLSQGEVPAPSRDALSGIEIVPDSDELSELRSNIVPLVDPRCRVHVEAVNERGWTAMPVNADMDYMDTEWIAQASQDIDCTHCYAIPCRESQDLPMYKVSMKQDVLLAFYEMFYLENYVLCPPEFDFAIIGESRHYFVIVGTASFVESAVGATLETAADEFAYSRPDTLCGPSDSLPDDSEIEDVDDLIVRFGLDKLLDDYPSGGYD